MTTSSVTTTSVTERKKHLENNDDQDDQQLPENSSDTESEVVSKEPFKMEIVWRNVFLFVGLHIGAACGLYCAIFTAKWQTNLLAFIGLGIAGVGSSVAAHRLWCHRTFKAKLPLRIMLMIANCFALQNDIYEWTRDHRVHHKFSDTDADPHNINRGFFFAHMGWLMCKKHPEVFRKGATVDCSDVLQDPVVAFQRKYYVPLVTLFCFVLPTLVPMWLVGETFWNAHLVNGLLRYTISLHMTWLVNSAAHTWGYRPYDKNIAPTENPAMSVGMFGEGFHNFHHAFPQDYKSSEFGPLLNPATIFIDLMALIGQAYDLKTTPKHLIDKRIERTGDKKQHYLRAFAST
ncbi:acyl-CoA Delta-9 desaturase-like [Dermacentor andersoni]|uniref:acyl-CoA Delta-9 desaturase-like n=1 Tax=Dermacentor andersoni TaxID=34620 RepID=UPI00215554AA|nr:acyl-CoA Delta-9 desaturase-like [Dermacentor andersoni]